MTVKEPLSERNLDGYDAPPIAWERVRERLDQGVTQPPGTGGPDRHTYWLATTNPDGSPHVMPLGVFWVDGGFYFNAGPGTRKVKNLADNPRCVISVATDQFDLVVEGEAVKVTDDAELRRIADVFAAGGGNRPCATAPCMPSSARRAPAHRRGTFTRSRRRRCTPWGQQSRTAPPASASSPGGPAGLIERTFDMVSGPGWRRRLC